MTWPDKRKSILLSNSRINATLRPIKEKSVDFDNTKNLYIEGDNLDVLKLLRETYLNKIKMIYIDPPYNTGNDFVYDDDFSQSSEDYMTSSGQYDDHGNRLFLNNESNGRYHTNWLNMMYPRLKTARDFLTDDGAIFISIDEHEEANLRKICDDIYGPKNFIGSVIRKTKTMTGDDGNGFNLQHETLYIYAKNIDFVALHGDEKNFEGYSNPDDDPNGDWCSADPSAKSGGQSTYFEIINPYTGKKDFPPRGRYWAFSKSTLEKCIVTGKIKFKKEHKDTERGFIFKRYKKDASSLYNPLGSLFAVDNEFMNQKATTELSDLMGGNYFSYPKPVSFIRTLCKSILNNNDIVMDFFSGSGTTGNAVFEYNASSGKNTKFILIQLEEKCDNILFNNLCDIGEERIRRAGKKILEEYNKNNKGEGVFANESNDCKLDIGFRVLKLDSSNMNDVYYNAKSTTQSLFDSTVDNVKSDRTPLDLLFQVMLELGIELSARIEEKEISGKKYFIVNENDIVACFDSNVNNDVIKELAQIKPIYAVFRDSVFENDSANINCEQLFKSISPSTTLKVL